MYRFHNDYCHGAHPALLQALTETNDDAYPGYGTDEWSRKAADKIRELTECPDAAVHFMVGGTQTNYVSLEAYLRPYQSVISADTGHIFVHEAGAIEHSGHKVHMLQSEDGKITAQQIREDAEYHHHNPLVEHYTQPGAVYISYPTEYGTLYSKAELEDIRKVCDEFGLFLYIDGARLGYGLTARECDITLPELAHIADAFCIGGTKCGAMMGEALVSDHPVFKDHFRNCMKLNGAILAKGWLIGLQFYTLFKDGLYFDICGRGEKFAEQIQDRLSAAGYREFIKTQSNQLFFIFTKEEVERLERNFTIDIYCWIDEDNALVRLCTSWATTEEEVKALVEELGA